MKNNDILYNIKNDRIEILRSIRESIVTRGDCIDNSFFDINTLVNADIDNSKSCKVLLDTKNIISNLVLEISKCDNKEDAIKLRKKLNYYINKIKKELKNRNIPLDTYNEYCDRVSYLRNDISEVIKVFNRENNIIGIVEIISKDKLEECDSEKLKKLIKNERQFNRRLQVKYLNRQVKKREKKEEKLSLDDKLIISDNNQKDLMNIATSDLDESMKSLFNLEQDSSDTLIDEVSLDFDKNYLSTQISSNDISRYINMYDLYDLDDYDKGFFINILKFLRNIPSYILNKRKIKNMEYDYFNYSRIEDLRKFIDYSKYNNSLFNALDRIYSKTMLGRKLKIHSDKHDEYMSYLLSIKDEIDRVNKRNDKVKSLELIK